MYLVQLEWCTARARFVLIGSWADYPPRVNLALCDGVAAKSQRAEPVLLSARLRIRHT